ncbi:MAG TPA: ankyrin repeat domain-containing protein [Vicinamibacterales bacterium]|nr:ankyrin repeat domain-containing protein [Vicinamibacterales bacterium]
MRIGASVLLFVALASPTRAEESLIDAVKHGNHQVIHSLLSTRADVNAVEPDGTSALHWAVRGSDLETVRLLIGAGARVNASNRYGVTPLSLAALNGDASVTGALLDAGADVNAPTPAGETPLMAAARTGNAATVKVLLERGADVSAREHAYDEDALMWAAAENHQDVVRLLVQHGSQVNAHARVLRFPNVKVDAATMVITALPRGGLTPLMYAARQGAIDSARALVEVGAELNATDPDGMTPLVIAIINAHYDVASMLVERGADPNAADITGMAAVYAAVDMHTLDPLVNRPAPTGNTSHAAVDLVKTMLEHHANPNATLKAPLLARQHNFGDAALGAGATPLMRAAKNGDVEMMDVLLAHGAVAGRAMPTGMTALLFAVTPGRRKSAHDALAASTLCLDHGADVNAADGTGQTALHLAVGLSDDLVKLLAARGARLDVKDRFGRTPLDVAMGVAGGAPGRGGRAAGPAAHESTAALLRELAAAAPPSANSR